MIRLIYIGDQINEDETAFAFWDTVVVKFITLAGEQSWTSLEDLRDCAKLLPVACVDDDLVTLVRERLVPMAEADARIARTEPVEQCLDCGAVQPHHCQGVPGGFGD